MSAQTPIKSLLIGISLAFLTNCILLTTSFVVGKIKLSASEIGITKGVIQSAIYGGIYLAQYFLSRKSENGINHLSNENKTFKSPKSFTVWAFIFCVANAVMTTSAYIALYLIPVPDFVVMGHTAPIFTVILSTCILSERITPLKSSLVLTVIIGVVLIVQPTFIFPSSSPFNITEESISVTNVTQNLSTIIENSEEIQNTNSQQYYIGILITLFVAISAALVNVSAKKSIDVPRTYLLFCAGIGMFIFATIMHLCLLGSDLSEIPDIPTWKRYILTTVVALGSMIAGHLLVSANQNAPPVVVAVIRASNILLALIVDKLVFRDTNISESGSIKSILHSIGAILVLIGTSFTAASEYIQEKIDKCCNTPSKEVVIDVLEIEKLNK